MIKERYSGLVAGLVRKMKMSQTPVPGFIMGLSGKDSLVAFLICYDACAEMGIAHRLLGIHYVRDPQTIPEHRRAPSWFEQDIIPWLRQRCPKADIRVATPLGGNQDQQRWADLHLRALHDIAPDGRITTLDPPDTYWVVGTITASEMILGRYSMMAKAVSVQPLQKVRNTQVIQICIVEGVPDELLIRARTPDCLCGRDEIAANNIELIDDILFHEVKPSDHPVELLTQMIQYVHDVKRENDWKNRVPYLL